MSWCEYIYVFPIWLYLPVTLPLYLYVYIISLLPLNIPHINPLFSSFCLCCRWRRIKIYPHSTFLSFSPFISSLFIKRRGNRVRRWREYIYIFHSSILLLSSRNKIERENRKSHHGKEGIICWYISLLSFTSYTLWDK